MKRLFAVGAALALTVGLVVSAPAQGQATYELNIGSLAPTHSVWWEMLKEIERAVETESGGRLDMIIRPPGQMGEVEMVRETRTGQRLQACGVTTAAIAEGGNVPELNIIELPYPFDNYAEADAVLDSLFDPIGATLARRGFVLAAWSENGMRSFATKSVPIHTPADLHDLRMRSQESAVHMAMYEAYGAQPVQKSMTETLTALQSDVVVGLDNAPLFLNLGGLSSSLQYYTLTEHIYQPAAVIYSKRWYDALPDDIKTILNNQKSVAVGARARIRSENQAFQELLGEELTVIELTPEQRAEFVRIGRGMHDSFAATVTGGPELLAQIRAELARVRH